MRRLGHALRLLMFTGATLWMAQWTWQWLTTEFSELKVDRRAEDAESTVTYVLAEDRWTEFAVTGQGDAIRVFSTANVPAGARSEDNPPLTYALQYQLLSRGGEVLEDRVYHQRTRLANFVGAQGDVFSPYFYQGIDVIPGRSQRLMIDLGGLRRPAVLRLRLAEYAAPITDVTVRVYERAGASLGTTPRHFDRLTLRQQYILGNASIYGAELLRDEEKLRLMRTSWEPTGPTGVGGVDYVERRLYVQREHDGTPPPEEVVPIGLYVDEYRRVRIPLRQSPERLRLRFQAINGATASPVQDRVSLHHESTDGAASRSFSVPVQSGEIVWERVLGGGWLEASATFAAAIKMYRVTGDGVEDVTPDQRYQRMYVVQPGLPITFPVDHYRAQATPFRVDVRLEDPMSAPIGRTRYQLLDGEDRILSEGELSVDPTPSAYDRGTGRYPYVAVSDAARGFFRLRPEVQKVRIRAEHPILINAYSRPPNTRYAIRIPDAYDPYRRYHDPTAAPPAWFSVRPVGVDKLTRENRVRIIAVQPKPQEDNALIADGDFDWIDYLPDGEWLARHVLNPREPDRPLRSEAAGAVFNAVPVGVPVPVHVIAETHREFVAPTLIFLRDTTVTAPFILKADLDGRPILNVPLSGMRGELRLPAISTGRHTLKLASTAEARWFINHTTLNRDPVTRRLVYRLDRNGLQFDFHKETVGEETLSARVQMPRDAVYPARIRLRVDDALAQGAGSQPLPNLTLTDRVFEITAPAGPESVPILGSTGFADLGHTLFVPFGAELPPGRYRVSVSLSSPGEGYLSVYRLRAGRRPEHRVFLDTAGGPE